jgi:hypothetical protein
MSKEKKVIKGEPLNQEFIDNVNKTYDLGEEAKYEFDDKNDEAGDVFSDTDVESYLIADEFDVESSLKDYMESDSFLKAGDDLLDEAKILPDTKGSDEDVKSGNKLFNALVDDIEKRERELESIEFKPTEELVLFAEEFSKHITSDEFSVYFEKYEVLLNQYISNSKLKTSHQIKYISKYNNYTIKLVDSEEFNFARISHTTGVIEFPIKKIINESYSDNFFFYIVIWCVICKEIKNYSVSDKIALRYYLTTGKPKEDILIGYTKLFSESNNESNLERMNYIKDILKD